MTDLRWTGGIANRGWQSGTRPGPLTDADYLAEQVGRYLTDCRVHKQLLSPAHHPTEKGCLQVVFRHGDAQKQLIREIYRQLTGAAAS